MSWLKRRLAKRIPQVVKPKVSKPKVKPLVKEKPTVEEPKVEEPKVEKPKPAEKETTIRWAFKRGIFLCQFPNCGRKYKTEKGVVAHIERDHPGWE
jgi:hypothetical protein